MALKVIGAGLGRTGTLSLKLALEHIGFGPCYHAMELPLAKFGRTPLWSDAIRGRPDWDAIFDGYQSTTDYPGCCFWRELMDHFPEAKVLLSVRDPDSWYDSMSATLLSLWFREQGQAGPMGELNRFFARDIAHRRGDRTFVTDYFKAWNQAVIDAVPADRLLVFSAKDGWDPLCAFLGVPVPDAPYPRVNARDELNQELGELPKTLEDVQRSVGAYLDDLRQRAFGP
jgi:hypothetical protein